MKKIVISIISILLFFSNAEFVEALNISNSGEDYQTNIGGNAYGTNLNSPNAAGSPIYISSSQVGKYESDGYNVVRGQNGYIAYKNISQSGSYNDFNLSGNIYTTENGDAAYCLTPGRLFRRGEFTQTSFDASGYQYANEDVWSRVSWILTQPGYSYGVKLNAARKVLAESNISGADSFGVDDELGFSFDGLYSSMGSTDNNSVGYKLENNKIFGNVMKVFSMSVNAASNVSFNNSSDLDAVMTLYNQSATSQSLNITPSLDLSNLGISNSSISVDSNSVTVPLAADDPRLAPYADQVKIEIGRYVDGKWESLGEMSLSECQKNSCAFKVENLCSGNETTTTDEYKIRMTVPGATEGGGVQMYVNSNSPEDTQIMMVVPGDDAGLEQTPGSSTPGSEEEKEMVEIESDVTINCLKDCETGGGNSCPNGQMKVSTDSGKSCTGASEFGAGPYDTYEEGYAKDPAMSCIINACDSELKDEYKVLENDTCVVYCRSETKFYMANKTKVYAGMQFEYDINIGEKKKSLSENSPKLSAIVYQKKQCTTETFYDRAPEDVSPEYSGNRSWLQRYASATQAMVSAWYEYKHAEALLEWESKNDPKDKFLSNKEGYTYSPEGECGCDGSVGCGKVDVYRWKGDPFTASKLPNYGKYSGTYEPKDAGQLSVKLKPQNYSAVASLGDGNPPENGGYCDIDRTPDSDPDDGIDDSSCSSSVGSPPSCKDGDPGEDIVNEEYVLGYKNQYITAAQKVQELLFNLQSCSLYTDIEIPDFYEVPEYSGDIIIDKINGNIENDINLYISYDDQNYGEEVEIERSGGSSSENMYYCVNGGDERNKSYLSDCYNYSNGYDEPSGGNETESHIVVSCSGKLKGAKCEEEEITLPTNDYATFIMEQEADFSRNVDYYTKAYTGQVFKGTPSGSNDSALPSTIFPVSNDKQSGSTGLYGIDWRFTGTNGIGLYKPSKINQYLYSCSYEVYNTTTLYDCPYLDEEGNIDWEKCNNPCYVDDGKPVPDVCIEKFDPTENKNYGFIYRNVELNNLFPTQRVIGNNWSNATDIIEKIQSTSESVWSDEYLEYSFTLTPQAINNIRNYNDEISGIGGYLNNTLYACDREKIGSSVAFKNCKSSFLDLYKLDEELGVQINKYSRLGGAN